MTDHSLPVSELWAGTWRECGDPVCPGNPPSAISNSLLPGFSLGRRTLGVLHSGHDRKDRQAGDTLRQAGLVVLPRTGFLLPVCGTFPSQVLNSDD